MRPPSGLPTAARCGVLADMMRASSPGAFFLSASFHAAVLAVVVGLAWRVAKTRSEPPVFVLFPGDQIHLSPKNDAVPGPVVSMPRIRVTIPKATPLVLPAPVAAPRDERASVAKPSRPDTAKPAPRNGGPLNPTAVPAAPIPQVDASSIVRELLDGAEQGRGSQPGPARDVADDSGFDRLRTALAAAHRMPGSVPERCTASVQFDLAANGAISGAQLTKSSGNADFDRSVLDAFARVAAIGLAPIGRAGRFVIPFRLTE